MRMPSVIASAAFAAAALTSTAALAGPISVGPAGPIVTTETSWETPTLAVNDILQGVIEVTAINNGASITNPVYLAGGGGQFLSAVFGGFQLTSIATSGSQFTLTYTGGWINYYTSATNPFSNLNTELNGTLTNAINNVTAGSLWASFTAQTIDGAGDTLVITGTQQGTGLTSIQSSGTSTVYLDLTGGAAFGQFAQNTFTNPWLNQLADASYQGSANSGQCAQYFITSSSPFQICGSNNLSTNVIPEPITLSVFGAGLVGAAALRRRKAKKAA